MLCKKQKLLLLITSINDCIERTNEQLKRCKAEKSIYVMSTIKLRRCKRLG